MRGSTFCLRVAYGCCLARLGLRAPNEAPSRLNSFVPIALSGSVADTGTPEVAQEDRTEQWGQGNGCEGVGPGEARPHIVLFLTSAQVNLTCFQRIVRFKDSTQGDRILCGWTSQKPTKATKGLRYLRALLLKSAQPNPSLCIAEYGTRLRLASNLKSVLDAPVPQSARHPTQRRLSPWAGSVEPESNQPP